MRLLPLTLPTPAENLALDEALLEEASAGAGDVLRIWESPEPMVVVGRSSRVVEEVDQEACRRAGASVLRRVSGGAAIVAAPGCLMYAVSLGAADKPWLASVDRVHSFVLDRISMALGGSERGIRRAGTSDLVLAAEDYKEGWRKFSGNSLRVTRGGVLYHGTLMYDCDLSLVGSLLRRPPRQPEYRGGRDHDSFLTNLPLSRQAIADSLAQSWTTGEPLTDFPRDRVARLVEQRYLKDSWNQAR